MLHEKSGKIYMIGIKGTGMSSLAVLLKKMGYRVTGSDTPERFFTESQLKSNKISYYDGFDAEHITKGKPDFIIISTAYNDRNAEISQAKLSQIPMISYPQAVGAISETLTSVAVCGSHGKTTTTSMLGSVMQTNGRTVTLTGTVAGNINNRAKKPEYFVFEADEYQNKFQYYSPANIILTNVDFDHPDFFTDTAHYNKTFKDFISRVAKSKGYILYNMDDSGTRHVIKGIKSESYGFHPKSDYLITPMGNGAANRFTISHKGTELIGITLSVYGTHNILNAAASAIMSLRLGIKPATVKRELKAFQGVKRRMEVIPSKKYTIIDDYGHHPTEVTATLKAIRGKYPDKNIVTVFHPHTFTRTKALLEDFGKSFKDVDLTIVLDIYPSAREVAGGVHALDVVKEITKNGSKAIYAPTIPHAAAYIKKNVPHGSVVITIGAGDVWKLCDIIK
jgi:UDP-N-acetylmuramate--alanine ligase